MKTIIAFIMILLVMAGCNKLTTKNQVSPIVFGGIKSIDTTSKGTAIIVWDPPRGAPVSGFEVYFEDLTASDSDKALPLRLADESGGAQDVPAILVDLPDEHAPFTKGRLLRAIDSTLNSYEITKLLPGRYAIQVKAIGADGAIDANKRVALLKVDSKLGYEGISKAEVQGQNAYLEWPQLETTLTSREVIYTIYEGATFANPVAITTSLNFQFPLLGYRPGTVLYFGVRSTDAKGRTDRNNKTISITVPSADADYLGCVSGQAQGSDRITIKFAWPKETFQTMKILRDGVQVYSTADAGVTDFVDVGLQEGEGYTYTCLAVYKDRVITGLQALKVTTLTSNPPTFKGVASVDILSPHSAILRWGVATGVPAASFNIYMTPGTTVDWNSDPIAKIEATKLEWTTTDLGDDLTYAFGVRACSSKNVCDFNTIQLTGSTGDDGAPKTVGATALAIIDSKLRVTAPWIHSQGGINKRLVYMKAVKAPTVPPAPTPTFVLVSTVAVTGSGHPPTELLVQPIDDNTTYSVIVYDQDIHGNRNAITPEQMIFSGDTHKPIFGGIATVTQGVGIASNKAEETTLRINFTAIAAEPADSNGATDYVAYVAPGIMNACNLTTGYQFFPVASYVGVSSPYLIVTGLTPMTTYSLCLKARDAAGNISDNVISFTKSTLDITPPIFDGIQTVDYDKDTGKLLLKWNPSPSTDVYEFRIILWKGISEDPANALALTTTVRANVAATGTDISQSTFVMESSDLIHVLVSACDNAGSVAGGTQNCSVHEVSTNKSFPLADIDPPPGFLGIRSANDLVSTTQGTITVKWVAPSDWTAYKGFKVYYVDPATNAILSMAKDCPCTVVSCPEELTQCDLIGLEPFRTYRLHVRAYDASDNMTILDPATYSTNKRAIDTQAPTFASNLQLSFANGKADLAWGTATDNQFAEEPGAEIIYEVYRKVDEPFTFTAATPSTDLSYPNLDEHAALMTRIPSGLGTTWTDSGSGFDGGLTFYYTVCAVDGTGNRYCDGVVKSFLCPDLVPPVITSFTSTKTPTSYQWDLNWVAADVVTADANLQYKIYKKESTLEIDQASIADSLIYIASGTPTFTGLRGQLNANIYIHYMLVVADADGNKAYKYLTVYSDNLVTISSIRSTEGPKSGGKTLVVIGDGFKLNMQVRIGASVCGSAVRYSKKHLLCTSPISTDIGKFPVTVENPDGSTAVLTDAYTYCDGAGCLNDCNTSKATLSPFASGSGASTSSPYLICTAAQLDQVRNQPYNKFFKLGENINLSGVTFAPITSAGSGGLEFKGTFNGDNFVISNWTYGEGNADHPVGLFRRTTYGYFSNLGLINFNVVGRDRVGLLIGAAGFGQDNNWYPNSITGVFATGTVTGRSNVGGLVVGSPGTELEFAL